MSDSVQPHRRQPTRLPRPWDSPDKITGVGCHFLLQCMKVTSESEVAQSCLTLSDPMDCSPPASSVHGFSRQEYWSGVPLPSLLSWVDTISCCLCSIDKKLRLEKVNKHTWVCLIPAPLLITTTLNLPWGRVIHKAPRAPQQSAPPDYLMNRMLRLVWTKSQ